MSERHDDEADKPPPENAGHRREPALTGRQWEAVSGKGEDTPRPGPAPRGAEGTVCNPDFWIDVRRLRRVEITSGAISRPSGAPVGRPGTLNIERDNRWKR